MLKRFIDWSQKNNIILRRNDELFFINQRLVIKPDFRVGVNIYIDLIRRDEITEIYLAGCQQFAQSYGVLIVVPIDVIPDLEKINKEDIESRYDIKF